MSNRVPQKVAATAKKIVFDKADEADYLAMSRTDSGSFLNELVDCPGVGEEIAKYVKQDQVRHYIKDAILNRYSKDKMKNATPDDVRPIIKASYGLDVEESHGEGQQRLYRATNSSQSKEYVVVVEGTYLKWETALKKALLFIAAMPFSKTADDIHILLLLYAQHRPIPPSDIRNLKNALSRCNALPHIYGER